MAFINSSSIYVEDNFDISYKILSLIGVKLNSLIYPSELFNKKYKGFQLVFIDSSKRQFETLTVKGPSVSKKYQCVEYVIYIPYLAVLNSDNYLETYLNFYEQGVIEVLSKYQIDATKVPEAFTEIKKEVIDNPDYEYKKSW